MVDIFILKHTCEYQWLQWGPSLVPWYLFRPNRLGTVASKSATLALSLYEAFVFGLDFSISSSILDIAILNLAIQGESTQFSRSIAN